MKNSKNTAGDRINHHTDSEGVTSAIVIEEGKKAASLPDETLRVFALGGMDEDGKNMLCIEINGDIYIAEAGLRFPDPKTSLGIECIIQDLSYLEENKDRVKAILITHGHDDVMGALPYLLRQVRADIYASSFTAAQISRVLKKNKIKGVKVRVVKRDETRKIGGRQVVFFPVTHSFPQAYGFGIRTHYGYVVYSGEFIEDYDDMEEIYKGDYTQLSRFKNDGVLLLLTDSKGADRSGHTSPAHRVRDTFNTLLSEHENNRIFVEIFTQSVYRIQEIISSCIEQNRKMCFYTKELQELIAGLEEISDEIPLDLVISNEQIDKVDNCVVIISGQGRPLFNLVRNIANNEVKDVSFADDDVIAVATPLVPGVEDDFKTMENDIYKRGGTLIKIDKNVVGMHPAREDLKMMIFMLNPKYYIPFKGEYRMLCANAMIAEEMGIPADNIRILDNGQVALFENGVLINTDEMMELRELLVDGKENWDQAGVVIKDRETLSTDGVMVLAIGLDSKTKKVVNGPDVQTRGFLYMKDAEHITKEVIRIMEETIEEAVKNHEYENLECRAAIRDKVQKYLFKATAKRPMVLPVILEINEKQA